MSDDATPATSVARWVLSATPHEIERRILEAEILAELYGRELAVARELLERVRAFLEKPVEGNGWSGFAAELVAEIERMEPDAVRGLKVRMGNPDGRPPKAPSDRHAELWTEVRAEYARHPRRGWKEAHRKVGARQDPPISGRQMYRLTGPYRKK